MQRKVELEERKQMFNKIASAIMLSLLVIGMLAYSLKIQQARAQPRTLIVPDDYLTIQGAVNAANDGDSVFVRNGTYYENVQVNKALSLVGENKNGTIIDGSFNGSAVQITANNVRFEGFTVTHGGEDFPYSGILLQLSTNCTISNNIAIKDKMGLLLVSSSGNRISDNFVSGNIHGVEFFGFSDSNVLENNSISDNNAGIVLSQSSHNMMESNVISRNNFGFEVGGGSDYNMISGNTVSDAPAVGIRCVDESDNNIILSNIVTRSLDAFDLTYSNGCILIGNTASSNIRYGVVIYSSNSNQIIANDFVNDGCGFETYFPNMNNAIYHNNFINNTVQTDTFFSPITEKWDNGYPSGGNYWSDYNGTDNNSGPFQDVTGSDSIGDTPYVIDGNNTDHYPLIQRWGPYEAGTIHIRADGSIDPPTAPIFTTDNVTYFLTSNITADVDGIAIERNNIVVDGTIHALQGGHADAQFGIDLSGTLNVTIRNMQISGFFVGLFVNSSLGSSVCRNCITDNSIGVYLLDSLNSGVLDNVFVNDGLVATSSFGNVVSVDLVNGKPLVYLEGVSGNTVNNAGEVVIVDSTGIQIQGLDLSNATFGAELWASNNCTVSQNNVTNNFCGIILAYCSNNGILENNVTNNLEGLEIDGSSNNTVSGNNVIANNGEGLFLLVNSTGNMIFHNNLYGNSSLVFNRAGSINAWDDGYPSGGNYWSGYSGIDMKKGPNQDQPGSDGIGDTPYVIDSNNLDNYPLISPYAVKHIVGDLNSDGKVSLQDFQLLVKAYGSKPGNPNWNPMADVAAPYGIISLTDLVTMAMHYGQHYP